MRLQGEGEGDGNGERVPVLARCWLCATYRYMHVLRFKSMLIDSSALAFSQCLRLSFFLFHTQNQYRSPNIRQTWFRICLVVEFVSMSSHSVSRTHTFYTYLPILMWNFTDNLRSMSIYLFWTAINRYPVGLCHSLSSFSMKHTEVYSASCTFHYNFSIYIFIQIFGACNTLCGRWIGDLFPGACVSKLDRWRERSRNMLQSYRIVLITFPKVNAVWILLSPGMMLASDVAHVAHMYSSCVRLFLSATGCKYLLVYYPYAVIEPKLLSNSQTHSKTQQCAQSRNWMIHVVIFQNLNVTRHIRQPRFQNIILPLIHSLRRPIGIAESGTHSVAHTIVFTRRRERWHKEICSWLNECYFCRMGTVLLPYKRHVFW